MSELPTGTVTFLFTDVEGSTKLLHELGAEAYAEALAEHRRVIREACTGEGGVEVDTQGDAFFFAFPSAPGALTAAAAFTEELSSGPIQVRVGLHTGTPLLAEEGYIGDDVHRAARIASAGHGGQVLVSASTASLVDLGLRDLGEHRLKDLSAAQRIYQVGYRDHPPLTSLLLTNLPVPSTPFLGREHELDDVTSMLAAEHIRLLTLTGPGGTGKTRLAAQAAGFASAHYPDGVWWVPLAPLHDPELVLSAAAQVLGARDGLHSHIAGKRLLLLFDNFEHVMEAANGLGQLLESCRNLKLLVTSREPLHLSGEQEYPVPPLTPEEGISLFLARARAVKPEFEADEHVASICRRLDELPLALELAAARVKVLSPRQILERLDYRLPVLTGGARDAPVRQQTLRATIDWSYDLLSGEEQQLFRGLSVFAGGCTLEAAEEVAEADLDTLQALADKSLLRYSDERYWMLETIREFAMERLADSGERGDVSDRHSSFLLALVEEAEPNLTGPDQQQWFERLAREQDNIRDALEYACESGDGERALMLAGTIWRFWWTRGQIDEAASWYERAFDLGGSVSERARARGLFGMAHVAEASADVDETRALFEQAAALLRRLGDTRWLILALTHLAGTFEDADPERAEQIQLEALALAEASGDRRGIAIVKSNLARQLLTRGEPQRAAQLTREAIDQQRAIGDVNALAWSLADVTLLSLREGKLEAAAASIRESLELSRSIGGALVLSVSLPVAAAVVLARGNAHGAARLCSADEALCSARGIGLEMEKGQLLHETALAARASLGDRFEEEWASGAELDSEAAIELALDALGDA